jgi:hypothetical protein
MFWMPITSRQLAEALVTFQCTVTVASLATGSIVTRSPESEPSNQLKR